MMDVVVVYYFDFSLIFPCFIKLVECIRPLLTTIRHTPHGKRIYNKINREHPLTPNTILQPTVSNTLVYPNNYMGDKGGGETGHSYHSHQFHPQQYQQSAMYLQL